MVDPLTVTVPSASGSKGPPVPGPKGSGKKGKGPAPPVPQAKPKVSKTKRGDDPFFKTRRKGDDLERNAAEDAKLEQRMGDIDGFFRPIIRANLIFSRSTLRYCRSGSFGSFEDHFCL